MNSLYINHRVKTNVALHTKQCFEHADTERNKHEAINYEITS